jgi:hypothetical protein
MKLVGVYPLGEDTPRYPVSTIFLVLAQVLLALQVLQAPQAPRVLPSPVPEVSIDCSQPT